MMTEKLESEAYFVKIAQTIPTISSKDEDDMRKEIREIKDNQEECFGESLENYVNGYVAGFKLVGGNPPNIPIDKVWSKIISDARFPNTSSLLKAALSLFHSTATVEGSIQTTRNILNERAHRLLDRNLNARKIVKSAVRNSNSQCCYDYDLSKKNYMSN